MEIVLDKRLSVFENAQKYFEKAKKIEERIKRLKEELEKLKKEKEEKEKKETKKIEKKKEWYEQFRWFITSTGFLVIAGKDANTNELLIKKYTEEKDIVIHPDIVGAPFTVIKTQGKEVDEQTIKEACQFAASYSKAWKMGLHSLDVYWVYPNQVSKKAPSGEYLKKGSFMIYGKKNYLTVKLELAIGIDESGNIVQGVPSSVHEHSVKYVVIVPGRRKKEEIAEKICKILGTDKKEEIMKWIPEGSEIHAAYLGKKAIKK